MIVEPGKTVQIDLAVTGPGFKRMQGDVIHDCSWVVYGSNFKGGDARTGGKMDCDLAVGAFSDGHIWVR